VTETSIKALESLIKSCECPLVLDADALNILAANPGMLGLLPGNTILTPHPGEFDRLAGHTANGKARNLLQLEFARKYKAIVVLKGAYSSIAMPDGTCHFNSTGNPGMATPGSGDVLTGVILSLLAQGYRPEHAALMGTCIHGLAGDMAASEISMQALIASDIIDNLGAVFLKFENYDTHN